MAQFYIYFISSLPMLHFGMRPPFSFDKFMELAEGLLGEKEGGLLKNLPAHIDEWAPDSANATVSKWLAFDTSLRNELARIRGRSKKIETERFIRHEEEYFSDTAFIAAAVHRNPRILDAEQALDAARWARLEELSLGHYFDLDALIIYAYKLKILQRWDKVNSADRKGLLENASAVR